MRPTRRSLTIEACAFVIVSVVWTLLFFAFGPTQSPLVRHHVAEAEPFQWVFHAR
jgi:hypothetical protein